MRYALALIGCKPWMLNGLSERLIVSHYENDYGAALRLLNTICSELETLDLTTTSGTHLRALKREELAARGSVALHELYFGTLGGDGAARFAGAGHGSSLDHVLAAAIDEQFGSFAAWRREFVHLPRRSLTNQAGWCSCTRAATTVYSIRSSPSRPME